MHICIHRQLRTYGPSGVHYNAYDQIFILYSIFRSTTPNVILVFSRVTFNTAVGLQWKQENTCTCIQNTCRILKCTQQLYKCHESCHSSFSFRDLHATHVIQVIQVTRSSSASPQFENRYAQLVRIILSQRRSTSFVRNTNFVDALMFLRLSLPKNSSKIFNERKKLPYAISLVNAFIHFINEM